MGIGFGSDILELDDFIICTLDKSTGDSDCNDYRGDGSVTFEDYLEPVLDSLQTYERAETTYYPAKTFMGTNDVAIKASDTVY